MSLTPPPTPSSSTITFCIGIEYLFANALIFSAASVTLFFSIEIIRKQVIPSQTPITVLSLPFRAISAVIYRLRFSLLTNSFVNKLIIASYSNNAARSESYSQFPYNNLSSSFFDNDLRKVSIYDGVFILLSVGNDWMKGTFSGNVSFL